MFKIDFKNCLFYFIFLGEIDVVVFQSSGFVRDYVAFEFENVTYFSSYIIYKHAVALARVAHTHT